MCIGDPRCILRPERQHGDTWDLRRSATDNASGVTGASAGQRWYSRELHAFARLPDTADHNTPQHHVRRQPTRLSLQHSHRQWHHHVRYANKQLSVVSYYFKFESYIFNTIKKSEHELKMLKFIL